MGVVVGAAVLRDGRLLAARRTWPEEHAGRWELPGGRVEPGEQPEAALVREIAEELDCTVAVERWLPGAEPVAGGRHVLRVAVVSLLAGEPVAREHDALRWLDARTLHDVDWLEPDRPFLGALRPLLTGAGGAAAGPVARGVLHEEGDARAVAERLRADGWEAAVEREAFAGEDDDEDHAWAVVTDAPAVALELLVDDLDGWVEEEPDPASPGVEPPPLPTAPRRVKRPGPH